MPVDPAQGELPWEVDPDPVDLFVMTARRALDRPEVEYILRWQPIGGRETSLRIWLDSCWRIDSMCFRILDLISSVPGDRRWTRESVRNTLNAVQAAYGCEEPF